MEKIQDLIASRNIDKYLVSILKLKGKKKSLLKVAEELNELSLSIIQHLTKGKSIEHIKSEIPDVLIQLELLLKILKAEDMDKIYSEKINIMLKKFDLI